jgi:hypothetical protein
MTQAEAFSLAVANVSAFGDTDVFPSPLDRFAFSDRPAEVIVILDKIDGTFIQSLADFPPENIDALAPLGYTAFRWVTQLDPVWNLYLLGKVISVAGTIERKRLPVSENAVFSYRFHPDTSTGHLFSDSTWRHYKISALEKSRNFPFVLVADIADFYSRVAHHRLENELIRLEEQPETCRRITKLLSQFSNTRSYGLPVGGPASRILAELALNPVDLYLRAKGIQFCRYVDDFHIFASSKQEAFSNLSFLSQILFTEGLSLQRAKTRILSTQELRDSSSFFDNAEISDVTQLAPEARLMRVSVNYDPYSATAKDDYEALKDAVQSIDIVGILARETAKSSIDIQVTKQAIAAIRALEPSVRNGAIATLVDSSNLEILAPVFSNVMRLLRALYHELDEPTRDLTDIACLKLFADKSHIIENEINLVFLLKFFGQRQSVGKEKLLIELFDSTPSSLIRKEIILIMAKWNVTYWLSNQLRRFGTLSSWERKAFIVASFYLSDEGRHWRVHSKRTLSDAEILIRDWYEERLRRTTEIPL